MDCFPPEIFRDRRGIQLLDISNLPLNRAIQNHHLMMEKDNIKVTLKDMKNEIKDRGPKDWNLYDKMNFSTRL